MDITKKLKSFVSSRQGSKSPIEPLCLDVIEADESLIIGENDPPLKILNDPLVDQQILESIEEIYYSQDSFDPSLYELEKVPLIPDKNEINNDRLRLKSQLQVVSKKLSDIILQNQSSLVEELQRVTEMQKNLEEACTICSKSRGLLGQAKQDFTTASLGILASYRKREQLKSLLRSLHLIKTLQETDIRLRELLEEEDYPGAIQLCLECQKAASTFKHYKCISELNNKLQDTLVMAEEQLDVALSKVCVNFDKPYYEKLQEAYTLLGKTQTAADQLLMHFASAIHNKAFTIVLAYVESNSSAMHKNVQKSQYSELCKLVASEDFTPCLVDLCKALWDIIYSYWYILDWHESSKDLNCHLDGEISLDTLEVEDAVFNQSYVKQKLKNGLLRVWQDVQQKVKAFILAADIPSFKFNEFIHILALVQKLMDIGEDFCGSRSDDLQESVRQQSVNYFRCYHSGFMEELRAFLENESWEICPVHSAFSAIHLQEFKFLKQQREVPSGGNRVDRSPSRTSENFFKSHVKDSNPFAGKFEEDETEDIFNVKIGEEIDGMNYESESDDSDIAEELKKDFIDENTDDVPSRTHFKTNKKQVSSSRKKAIPVLTNTALSVLRSFGKYMQMMSVLKPIAFDVLMCMTQLFDYYMYSVYLFFAKEMCDLTENILSNRLRTTLKRIRENLVCEEENFDSRRNKDMVPSPKLSMTVDLKNIENLYGLAERVAAAESLVFLAGQFQSLHPHLEALIPASKTAFLQQFCSQTISQASDLRRPVYMTVAARSVDYEQIVSLMASVRWDVQEIMSQHSGYVDIILRELQIFSMRLTEVSKKVPIQKEANDLLWEHCIKLANYSFIEGFSQAKKCTNGGRALMLLDYQQFLSKVESLTDLRPIPEKDQVEYYIKAYYYLELNLEQFIRTRKEYSNKQLIGLVNCISQLSKKGKQRLLTLIEESERMKR